MSTPSTIQDSIRLYLEQYFSELGGQAPANVYNMMLELIERPMLEVVMNKAGNNQCRATRYLGLARGTVIKKLKQYGLISGKRQQDAVVLSTPAAEEELV